MIYTSTYENDFEYENKNQNTILHCTNKIGMIKREVYPINNAKQKKTWWCPASPELEVNASGTFIKQSNKYYKKENQDRIFWTDGDKISDKGDVNYWREEYKEYPGKDFTSESEYIYQDTYFQYQDGDNGVEPLHDVFLCSGRIVEATVMSSVVIEKNITDLNNRIDCENNDKTSTALVSAIMVLHATSSNGTLKTIILHINSYNSETGVITFVENLTWDNTNKRWIIGDTKMTLNINDKYEIYTNYFKDKPHLVKKYNKSSVEKIVLKGYSLGKPTSVYLTANITLNSNYEYDYIKSYQFKLLNSKGKVIYETPKIYKKPSNIPILNSVISDTATLCLLYETYNGQSSKVEYKIRQLGILDEYANNEPLEEYTNIIALADTKITDNNALQIGLKVKKAINGSGDNKNKNISVFRRVVGDDTYTYIGKIDGVDIKAEEIPKGSLYFTDYTVGNNTEYEYRFIYGNLGRKLNDEGEEIWGTIFRDEIITTGFNGWSIYSLSPVEDDFCKQYYKQMYKIKEHWNFQCEVKENVITNKLGINLNTDSATTPIVTRSDTNYDSGSFSAIMESLYCDENYDSNYTKIKAWKSFIEQDCLFMLKSEKGDVWFVNISDNPVRVYDCSYNEMPTTITYNWCEVEDIDNIVVIGGEK